MGVERENVQRACDAIAITYAESIVSMMASVVKMLIVSSPVSDVAQYVTLRLTSAVSWVRCAWLDAVRLDAQTTLMRS